MFGRKKFNLRKKNFLRLGSQTDLEFRIMLAAPFVLDTTSDITETFNGAIPQDDQDFLREQAEEARRVGSLDDLISAGNEDRSDDAAEFGRPAFIGHDGSGYLVVVDAEASEFSATEIPDAGE